MDSISSVHNKSEIFSDRFIKQFQCCDSFLIQLVITTYQPSKQVCLIVGHVQVRFSSHHIPASSLHPSQRTLPMIPNIEQLKNTQIMVSHSLANLLVYANTIRSANNATTCRQLMRTSCRQTGSIIMTKVWVTEDSISTRSLWRMLNRSGNAKR